jgi:hypothetical protein
MDDKLPNDLPGGWAFDKPFSPEPLAVGQVWRKAGPSDAVKIERVMQPGQANHDGGIPGMSVRRTEIASKVRWKKDTEFWPGPVSTLHERLREGGYALAN